MVGIKHLEGMDVIAGYADRAWGNIMMRAHQMEGSNDAINAG